LRSLTHLTGGASRRPRLPGGVRARNHVQFFPYREAPPCGRRASLYLLTSLLSSFRRFYRRIKNNGRNKKTTTLKSMVVNLYATKCLHPAHITTGIFNKDSPLQLHRCYTAFPPRSRFISATFSALNAGNTRKITSRPAARMQPYFTGMNLSPARSVFTPWRGTSAMAMATLLVTGTDVTVSTPWTSMIPSRRVTFVIAFRL
jgi:hypothetical protein